MIPHDHALIINHPDAGFISVAGDDACGFLQSIITANVEASAAGACCPSALLTPQGRILIDMMVYRSAKNKFYMRCDLARRDDLFNRLRKYRLRRPIELTIETDLQLYLLIANKAVNQSREETLSKTIDHLSKSGEIIMACSDPRSSDLGTHILLKGDKINATSDRIDVWHKTRITNGIPEGAIDLTPERALMLEAGLDHLGAVDFGKGCYVGQEVTARTHYRGLVKRRLVPLLITGAPPTLHSDIIWNGKVIGTSRTTAPIDNGTAVCLALLKLSDIHTILDAGNNNIIKDKNGSDRSKNSGLTVNDNPASLAIPDWMMPLPRPKKS